MKNYDAARGHPQGETLYSIMHRDSHKKVEKLALTKEQLKKNILKK